jgi:hypothetical protein
MLRSVVGPEEVWGRGVWMEGCPSLEVERVSQWNCVQHRSGLHWFTDKDLNATSE